MNTAYKVILSNKVEIQIDQDELETVTASINHGSFCKVRKGMFNPSFLVAIVEDEERLTKFYDAIESTKKHNTLFPDKARPVPEAFRPLKDVFSRIKAIE